MKLKDWIKFNKPFYNGDIVVKVMKGKSYKQDDVLLETCVSVETCAKFFGECELAKFMIKNRPGSEFQTIGVILWTEEEQNEDAER